MTVIDSRALRARPDLVAELRANPGAHIERRTFPLHTGLELRASDESDPGYSVRGHAAVFDSRSENLGGFTEEIRRGAFRKVLRTDPDVRLLFNHNPDLILARTHAGTLTLREEPRGLVYDGDVADTSTGRDLKVLMQRGDVDRSSFAFRVAPGGDEWIEDEETGALVRYITEFSSLYDVSVVTYPAYPEADAGLRTHLSLGEPEPVAAAEERGSEAPDMSTQHPALEGPDATWRLAANQRRLRLRDPR